VRTLPTTMIQALVPFAPLFSKRVWEHAQLLLAGAILAPGRRTVGSALRAVGLDRERSAFYRDPVRSSHGHYFVKASALRWVCVMVLVPIPWASRVWALPAYGPCPRMGLARVWALPAYGPCPSFPHWLPPSVMPKSKERGKRHKSLTEWAWQLLLVG
jgi:hypothetical protein